MDNYTPYHIHTWDSNLFTIMDSVTNYKMYVDKAVESGMKALAFSEHGNVVGWINKKKYCEEKGLKYIHAVEAYVTRSLDEKIRDNRHIVLIARNWEGVKEINKLMSHKMACNRKDGHFYYNPRITIDELINTSDNIIITSACLGGILNHNDEEMKEKFITFLCRNSDRCFLEIQHHNIPDQIRYNEELYELSQNIGVRLIAGTDTHSLDKTRVKGVELLQIAKNSKYNEEEGSMDLSFKTYEQLIEAYREQNSLPMSVVKEAINNTNVMADMVEEFELDKSIKYPKLYDNGLEILKQRIREGLQYRRSNLEGIFDKKEISDRINMELKVIKQIGAVDFILLEDYVKSNARANHIGYGYSRGSCSGSFICYLLGITEINSLKWNMNFFRFMNPERVSLCDVDTDWYEDDQTWVQNFLLTNDKFNSSRILTLNTIAYKGAVREVCRALKSEGMSVSEDVITTICEIEDIKDEAEKERTLKEYKKKYPIIFKYVDILVGTVVSFGSHPAGIIVTDRCIEEELGTVTLASSDDPVSCANMKEVDSLNFVKLDCLGLATIGIINKTCEMAGIKRLTPENVNFEDENVWRSIANDSTGIFQFESDMARELLKNMFSEEVLTKVKAKVKNFSYIKWFSFANGLLRPSCASFRDKASRGEFYDNGLEKLNEFLSPTLGYMVFQEQIMLFLVKFCGYSGSEADTVRRGIAKKYGTEQLLPEIERRFIEYSSKTYNIEVSKLKEVIKPVLQVILDASDYGFSENHSDPYSMIGYIQGYLRYYYPIEYCASSLNVFTQGKKKDKIVNMTAMVKTMGIEIVKPKFRYSKAEYMPNKESNSIYKGIGSIKYLSSIVADELYELRNNEYNTFLDLLIDIGNSTSLDNRGKDILIKLGFFEEFGGSKKLTFINQLYNDVYGKKVFNKSKLPCGISEDIFRSFAGKETKSQFREVDLRGLIEKVSSMVDNKDISIISRLKAEKEYLGYCDTTVNGLDSYFFVLECDTKYTPKVVLYCMGTGETIEAKISKKIWDSTIMEGTILIIPGFTQKEGRTMDKETGEWKPNGKLVNWILTYDILRMVI